jgi:hypothetical protein
MLRATIGVILLFSLNVLPLSAENRFSPYVDDKGNISFPSEFRDSMTHIGSWFVPEGGASGFHGVYTERESVDAFRETGIFPDGTVLVKELRSSVSGDYTTGKSVSHSTTTIKQWFVMVKDATNRYSDNPVWGDGWGWALFKLNDPGTNLAKDYKADCLGCHVPAKENDWVYTEAYPTLTKP